MAKARNGVIAALDIGTSKVVCFVARVDGQGLRVVGIGHLPGLKGADLAAGFSAKFGHTITFEALTPDAFGKLIEPMLGPATAGVVDLYQALSQATDNVISEDTSAQNLLGMQPRSVQQWLAEQGVLYPKIVGGFKALRRTAIEVIAEAAVKPLLLLAGPTGSGKTRLLNTLKAVDLEQLANHRGSAFGRHFSAQPSQIRFENDLASALLRVSDTTPQYILLEDESLLIGQRNIPHALFSAMQQSPLLLLEEPVQDRVEVILQDYVVNLYAEAQTLHAEQGFVLFSAMLTDALARIRKRLGGALYTELQTLLSQALAQQQLDGDIALHRLWIHRLLLDYYDPMYQYQLQKRNMPILMRGNATELAQWWQHTVTTV